MSLLGLIVNPHSLRNRKDASLAMAARQMPDIVLAETPTPAALAEAIADFRMRGIATLAIAGGDGTIRDALTAAARADYHPEIAILPQGKTNLAAQALGSAGPGPKGLVRLAGAVRDGTARRTEVPVVEVRWPDGRVVRGFLVGAGALGAATELATKRIHPLGINDGKVIAVTLGLAALSLLLGGGGELRRGQRMSVDGRSFPRFLLLATSLQRLLPRLDPFWGDGEGPLRWLDIAAPPRRLAAALLPVLRGRPARWMEQAGYRSGRSRELGFTPEGAFIIDGEAFSAGPDGIVLSAAGTIRCVQP